MRRRLTTALCIVALVFASVQAAAGVRVLCIGTGSHSEIEQIDQSAFYSAGNHARDHHPRFGLSAKKITAGADEKKSESTPGFDLVLVDEWTSVTPSLGLLKEADNESASGDHSIIGDQFEIRPPRQRRISDKVPPDYVSSPLRERLFDRLLL